MHKIPLFPLNTVLFPKISIPLNVFEDRYKCMIRHCIDTQIPFGVVLIRMGSEVGDSAIPYDVGTTANIINVNKIEDGRLFIIAIGDKIFRINKLIEDKSDVEILAIGIGHDVSRYYNKAIKITDVQELGDVMIGQLSNLFSKKNKKILN